MTIANASAPRLHRTFDVRSLLISFSLGFLLAVTIAKSGDMPSTQAVHGRGRVQAAATLHKAVQTQPSGLANETPVARGRHVAGEMTIMTAPGAAPVERGRAAVANSRGTNL